MTDLTPRQRQILEFIQDVDRRPTACRPRVRRSPRHSVSAPPMPPKSICARCSARVSLALIAGSSRGIVLKDALREQLGLPLIGRVAAGRPILAEEHIEGRFQIDPQLFSPRPHYLLRVSGMSMRDVGILDGDLVAVHRSPDVRNRQIIVARLENEVTVKRYRQEGTVVWLMPENPEFEPIRVDLRKQSLTIEGVVVGVLRRGRPDVMQ